MPAVLEKPSLESMPHRLRTFIAASLTLIVCFIASAAPIPLMSLYKAELALSTADVANSVVAYFAGCVATLLFFSRLSNYFGRKIVVLITLALAMAACAAYITMQTVFALNTARFLQGLSCGLASSAAMAWVVDAAPLKQRWLGTAMTAAGPNIGLTLGSFVTGWIVQAGWLTPEALFAVFIGLLACVAILVIFSTDTVQFGMETLISVFIPKVSLPKRLRRLFIVTAAAYIGTWGLSSFIQGFIAILARDTFGTESPFLASVCYVAMMAPNVAAGVFAGRFVATGALRVAVTAFVAGGACLFWAYETHHELLFLLAMALCGIGIGSCCTTGLKLLMIDTTLKERAGVIAAVYLLAYVGAGIPNFVVGSLATDTPIVAIVPGYIAWMLLAWLLIWTELWLIGRHPSQTEKIRFEKA